MGKAAVVSLSYDTELAQKGIRTEPGSLLIDQGATATALGRRAGFRPEEYIADMQGPILAAPGNHFGWQEQAYLIIDGQPRFIANDRNTITGAYPTFLQKEGMWQLATLLTRYRITISL